MGENPLRSGPSDDVPQALRRAHFAILAAANAASVAALHSSSAITRSLATSFNGSSLVGLVPMLALIGYASGVALIAFGPVSRGLLTVERHLGFLIVALLASAIAPNVLDLGIACFFVGAGAAVAPRLLASATRLVPASAAGGAIGRIVCGSLAAILCIRIIGDSAASVAGWRSVFFGAAIVITLLLLVGHKTGTMRHYDGEVRSANEGWRALWQAHPLLRLAAVQQAALFAAYNAGWITVLITSPDDERRLTVIVGSCAGIAAALVAGRLSDRIRPQRIAKTGAGAMLVAASLILPTAFSIDFGMVRILLLAIGMALVDAGLQVALVANQTRVQALSPTSRTRLAATLTVSGFLGGALGAGLASWLSQKVGWEAAIILVAMAASFGFGFPLFVNAVEQQRHRLNLRSATLIP